jgi:hypothetical protein
MNIKERIATLHRACMSIQDIPRGDAKDALRLIISVIDDLEKERKENKKERN